MRRRIAAPAKIVGSADQALAEVMLPDPINHDARRQGMIGACQPVGQLPAAAAFGDGAGASARQDPGKPLGTDLPSLL